MLKKFTVWDLIYAAEKKFQRKTDIVLLAAEFLKVKEYDYLPKMIVPLTLSDLQEFFLKRAKEISGRVVK